MPVCVVVGTTDGECSEGDSLGEWEPDSVALLVGGSDDMLTEADGEWVRRLVLEMLAVGVGGGVTVGVVVLVITEDGECVGLGIHVAELDPSTVTEILIVSETVVEKGGDLVGVQ